MERFNKCKFGKYDVMMKMLEIIKLDMIQNSTDVYGNQMQIVNSINVIESNLSLQQITGEEMKANKYKLENISQPIASTCYSIDMGVAKIREKGENSLVDAIENFENAICEAPISEIPEESKLDALQLLDELVRKTTSQEGIKSTMKALGREFLEMIKNVESISETLTLIWPIVERLWK